MGLYIGCGKGMQSGTYFFGLIDDVSIYNRAVQPWIPRKERTRPILLKYRQLETPPALFCLAKATYEKLKAK
jgi:hypothetical protein